MNYQISSFDTSLLCLTNFCSGRQLAHSYCFIEPYWDYYIKMHITEFCEKLCTLSLENRTEFGWGWLSNRLVCAWVATTYECIWRSSNAAFCTSDVCLRPWRHNLVSLFWNYASHLFKYKGSCFNWRLAFDIPQLRF